MIELSQTQAGVQVRALFPPMDSYKAPAAPTGARVDRLWETDVLEVFFMDEDGQYLEVELGAGGHYLVLGFDAPRHLVADFQDMTFPVTHAKRADGSRETELLIPRELFPTSLKALNAYAILHGRHLAYHPMAGKAPDFHQPDLFPFARLAS